MPIYDYKCPKCDFEGEFITKIEQNAKCPKCDVEMKRLLHSRYGINMGPCGAYGYYDDNLGQYVHTDRQRRRIMEEQGVTEKGATPKRPTWV